MTSRQLLLCCIGSLVPVFLVAVSSLAQSGAAFEAPSSPSSSTGGDLSGTYLRLDTSNDPLTGNLSVTGNIDLTGSISDSNSNYVAIAESELLLNGGVVTISAANGYLTQAGSARAWLRQGQSGLVSAAVGGYADSIGEVATYLGTTRTAAEGGANTGVILTAFAVDVDGTPDVVAQVTAQGEIQASGDSGSFGGFTLAGCDGCYIREQGPEELRINSNGTGGEISLRSAAGVTVSAGTGTIDHETETTFGNGATQGIAIGYDGARGYIDAMVGDEVQLQDGDSLVPEVDGFGDIGSESHRFRNLFGRFAKLEPASDSGGFAAPACSVLADAALYFFNDTATGDSNLCACIYNGFSGAPVRHLVAQGGTSTKCQ